MIYSNSRKGLKLFYNLRTLKSFRPTIGSNDRLLLIPALKPHINHLHITLHLNNWLFIHPVNTQSSHEGFPFLISQADPKVDHKSKGKALHQVSSQGPVTSANFGDWIIKIWAKTWDKIIIQALQKPSTTPNSHPGDP